MERSTEVQSYRELEDYLEDTPEVSWNYEVVTSDDYENLSQIKPKHLSKQTLGWNSIMNLLTTFGDREKRIELIQTENRGQGSYETKVRAEYQPIENINFEVPPKAPNTGVVVVSKNQDKAVYESVNWNQNS